MSKYIFRTLGEAIETIAADLTWLHIIPPIPSEDSPDYDLIASWHESGRPTDVTEPGRAGELSRQQEALIPRVRACTTWRQLVGLIKSEPEHIGDWLTKIPAPMRLQAHSVCN